MEIDLQNIIAVNAQKTPKSRFGKASNAFATSEPGAVGEHSSSFAAVPRQGIGNVANEPEGSLGQLGCDLGTAAGFDVC
jgi:hypothetical protein